MPRPGPLLLLPLVVSLALSAGASRSEGFGRWEGPVRRCQLLWAKEGDWPARLSGCLALRLDQTIEGLLRVRFIGAAEGSRFASEELTFVGLLLKQDAPMRCSQARCQPLWPMHMELKGITTLRFDARGLATQVPAVVLAQGSCRLEPAILHCEGMADRGRRWSASAELRELTAQPSPTAGRR